MGAANEGVHNSGPRPYERGEDIARRERVEALSARTRRPTHVLRNPGGYASITDADGTVSRENDTFTCAHNNEIVRVPVGKDPATVGRMCLCCMKHVCEACADEMDRTLKCVPFEKRLEEMESRKRFRFALSRD